MNIDQWRALTWSAAGVQLPAYVFNYPLVASPGIGGPMMASVSENQNIISYDPVVCGQMGADAAFFALQHEIGHHYHKHLNLQIPDDFMRSTVVKGLEIQADEYACATLIDDFPMDAPAIYHAAHGYFRTNNSNGGGSHPPDSERASNMEIQWMARCAVCRVSVTMERGAISRNSATNILATLNVPVFGATNQDHFIKEMEDGRTFVSEPFAYGDALKRLDHIRAAKKFWTETNEPMLNLVKR